MSTLDKLSATFAIVVAALSIVNNDWMWLGVSLLGLALLIFSRKNGVGFEYNGFLLVMAVVPLVAQSALGAFMLFEWTNTLWITSLIFQTWICVVYGYMLALLIDKLTDITLSKRWILLFSLLFAIFVSGVYLFFQFTSLYCQGYQVFNYDLIGANPSERIWMNTQLMTPPSVAVPISIILALVLRLWTKKTDKSELIMEVVINE